MTPEEAAELQRSYRTRRRVYAWRHGRPYSEDLLTPPPGLIDEPADEEG